MAKLNSVLYEKSFYDNNPQLINETNKMPNKISLSVNKSNRVDQFENLMNSINSKLIGDQILKDTLAYLNYLIEYMNSQEFDEICLKYLNKLNDTYKDIMNKIKSNVQLDDIIENLEMINLNYAKFFIIFNKNFQNYNDRHKNLIKIIPNGLKIYFKLFEEVFVLENALKVEFSNVYLKFSMNVISLINCFPTMMRTYESRLDAIYKSLFTNLIASSLINDKKLVKTILLTYAMLTRLSPDIGTKINLFLNKFILNIKYFKVLFEPKSIKTVKKSKIVIEEKDLKEKLIFNSELIHRLKNPKIIYTKNIVSILWKLIKFTFKCIPKNSTIELNFNIILNLIFDNIDSMNVNANINNMINETDFIVEGLTLDEFNLMKQYERIQSMKMCQTIVNNFSDYLYFYLPNFNKLINGLILNFESEFTNYLEVYLETLKLFKIFIQKLDTKIHTTIEDFIFKICINNFIDIYVSFLERNDKTVVKVDQNYFKLSNLKTQGKGHGQKKGKSVSLIQMARQDTINEKLEKFSNKDIETILNSYLEIFIAYFESNNFSYLLINNENKSVIKSLVDIVVLPPYSKFIYSIPATIKTNLINFIYSFIRYNRDDIEISTINRFNIFLKSFYSNDPSFDYKIIQINEFLNKISDNIFNTDNSGNNFLQTAVDLNKKVADKLKQNVNIYLKRLDQNMEEAETVIVNEKKVLKRETENKSFKIELSLREDENISQEMKTENVDSYEAYENNRTIKKQKIECDNENDREKENYVHPYPADNKSDSVVKFNVNKIFKHKWKQVESKFENEFTSIDGISLFIKDSNQFKNQITEKEMEREKMSIDYNKTNLIEESDSDIEIPDIF